MAVARAQCLADTVWPALFLATGILLVQAADARAQKPPTAEGEFEQGVVEANGLRFHYLAAGKGPLVLALHGFPDHPRTFRHQMRALAEAGYRVVAPFQRGYAPTDIPPDGPYHWAALAQDALGLIDALSGGTPVILLGHDWGAVAAYGAAIVAPEKVRKLVNIAVPYGDAMRQSFVTNGAQQRRSWYIFFFQMPYAELAFAHDDFAFLESLWRDWSPGWQIPREELERVKATFKQPEVLRAALSYYRHTFGTGHQFPTLEFIRSRYSKPISVPTLYLHGARDGGVGVELTEGMERSFTGPFEKVILPDAGHFVHQEQPEEVNRRILEFLARE